MGLPSLWMGDDRSDSEIIRASWDAPESFGEIVERYYYRVYLYVARRVGRQDARDVTADVFLNAFQARTRFDTTSGTARPWLFGIAFNLVGRRLRTIRRRQRLMDVVPRPRPTEDISEESVHRVGASSLSVELWTALAALSEADRETFLLYAVDGLNYREIGDALSVALGTVASRISRVRSRIREAIPDLERRTKEGDYPERGPAGG